MGHGGRKRRGEESSRKESQRPLHRASQYMVAAFHRANDPRERGQATKTEARGFFITSSKVIYHHLCHILLVTQINPGIVWEGTTKGYDYQE